ncbi:amidohydrolase family protein [Piscinibacterium candidicorallinum]|uniref:Amidohydrolase family protein n=1 Tax=Piscinibacterium candidicorallinum TaxID=1793872 RepID=A0ABV7H6Y7_9BURK
MQSTQRWVHGIARHSGQRLALLAAALLCVLAPQAQSATPTRPASESQQSEAVAFAPQRYVVQFQGRVSGLQLVRQTANGAIRIDYSYRENGRGPDMVEMIQLDTRGAWRHWAIRGKSTFGAPIEERFDRLPGTPARATWKSATDQGEAPAPREAVYLPVEYSPATQALIAAQLLRAPSPKAVPALPAGTLGIEALATRTVRSDDGRARRSVTLYAINGMGFSPSFMWMDSAVATAPPRERPFVRLFAVVEPSFAVIREGWRQSAETLLAAQKQAERAMLARLAKEFTQRPERLMIGNVRVFDSASGQLSAPSDVRVASGKIVSVTPAGSTAPEPGMQIVDGSGRTLLPGLFDMHSHVGDWDALLQIAGGITTARDMGNDNAYLAELIGRIERGETLGPRVVATGFIEGESPFAASNGIRVKDVASAKAAVDWYAERGFRQIKIYNSFKPEWVAPVAAHAHSKGMRVGGHIPAFMRAGDAVLAGYDEIQHINQVMLHFLIKDTDDTRTLLRFYLIGDAARDIDLGSPAVRDFIQLLVDRKVVVDPTLSAFEYMFLQRTGQPNPVFKQVADNVPVPVRRYWLTNSMDVNDQNAERFAQSWAKVRAFTLKLHQAGVPLVAGSDDVGGFTVHRELEQYVEIGIAPAEALQIATRNGARYTFTDDRTGRIAPGLLADMILVDGNPLENISAIRRISLVVKGGNVISPAAVYAALGIKPFAEAPMLRSAPRFGRRLH